MEIKEIIIIHEYINVNYKIDYILYIQYQK